MWSTTPMVKKIRFYYCSYCKQEIESPIKRPMDSLEKTIWVVITLSTLGFALIALYIYRKYIAKRQYCPYCLSRLEVSEQPFEKKQITLQGQAQTKKEEVLEKVEQIKASEGEQKEEVRDEPEGDYIFCPFCGERLKKGTATCPFCQTIIEF